MSSELLFGQPATNEIFRPASSLALVLAILCAAATGLGQGNSESPSQSDAGPVSNSHVIRVEPQFTFSTGASLVQIRVVVLDKHDRVVGNLNKESFRLQENGAQQAIAHFGLDVAPVSVCFIVDSSWSMSDRLQTAIDAVRAFLSVAQAADEYCLIRISGNAQLLEGLSTATSRIRNSLGGMHPSGLTALRDAIELGLKELSLAGNPHKALVILSDGGENNSRITQRQLFESITGRDIQVYAILPPAGSDAFYSPLETFGAQMLESIAHISGGRVFRADHAKDLASAIVKMDAALRQQYLLGYYTTFPDYRRDRYVSVALNPRETRSHFRIYSRSGPYPAGR